MKNRLSTPAPVILVTQAVYYAHLVVNFLRGHAPPRKEAEYKLEEHPRKLSLGDTGKLVKNSNGTNSLASIIDWSEICKQIREESEGEA
ncbi:hypothetical protein Ciccas_007057 [Cichlidogyrus casuarinus]|uniref:Uncharacterized protein n=1 Tax=Cichlidogyrus casuarinus TaxID=1844966 RepID=A0ABD2Q3Y4_9PLAT